jgi:hypothetical protein
MLALLYYIPDRWRKGSLSLPSGRQEGKEEGFRAYDDELISLRNSWAFQSKNSFTSGMKSRLASTRYHMCSRSGVRASTILGGFTIPSPTLFFQKNARSSRFFAAFCSPKKMETTTKELLKRGRSFHCFPHSFLSKEQNGLLCVTRRNWRIDVSVKHLSKVACQSRAYLRVILPTPAKRARAVLFSWYSRERKPI